MVSSCADLILQPIIKIRAQLKLVRTPLIRHPPTFDLCCQLAFSHIELVAQLVYTARGANLRGLQR